MAASRAAQNPPPASDLADSQPFLDAYDHYVAITVHSPASSTLVPEAFLAWLSRCCHALANEIHTAIPSIELHPHAAIFAPSPILANPLRCLMGVSTANASDPDLTARLTCGLQAFLSQLRQHSPLLAPKALGGSGIWLNARFLARSDLPSGPAESSNLNTVNSTSTSTTSTSTTSTSTSTSTTNTSIALFPHPIPTPPSQQPETPSSSASTTPSTNPPLPPSALTTISSSLLIVDEADPSATPTLSADATRPSARARTCIPPSSTTTTTTTTKLRPASDVLARLRWDQALGGPDAYIVGYWDRFVGVMEIGAGKWERESTNEEWVPLHRVEYVRRVCEGGGNGAEAGGPEWNGDDGLVWHRGRRIDRVFGSGLKRGPGDAKADGELEAVYP